MQETNLYDDQKSKSVRPLRHSAACQHPRLALYTARECSGLASGLEPKCSRGMTVCCHENHLALWQPSGAASIVQSNLTLLVLRKLEWYAELISRSVAQIYAVCLQSTADALSFVATVGLDGKAVIFVWGVKRTSTKRINVCIA
jgi:hypothetical protein